ncbi:MAG: hypothetical protein JO336_23445 [Acidobacteriia bacterium]|nr:hypothetical protein [Terriglobia bacterium]
MGLQWCLPVSVTALGIALWSAGPAAAQTAHIAAATQKHWVPARTPDGHPDMQGYWTNATYTPLERPKELGTKEFFTEAEAAAFEKQRLKQDNSQSADDVHYDNAIWQGENYQKTVSNLRTSLIFDPPDGRIPPLSEEGKKQAANQAAAARRRQAAESAQDRSLAERCIAWGNEGPPMLGSTYNANLQIVQPPGAFVITHEIIHGARIIPTTGQPPLPASIHQLGGDSRGHWEGDTLVVDSANFNDETNFRPPPALGRQDIFSDHNLHVVERFTLTDPDTILYRFTVEDPTVWTKPWSGELVLRRFGGPIFEYACHEGNYGLMGILAAARAAEKAAK